MKTIIPIVIMACAFMLAASCSPCSYPVEEDINTELFIENSSSLDLTLSNNVKNFPAGSKTRYTDIHCDGYPSTIRQMDISRSLGDNVTISFSNGNEILHTAIHKGDSIVFDPSVHNLLDSSSWSCIGEGKFSFTVTDEDL